MGAFVVYSFVSGLALLGGYLIYKWLLSTENQPRFNRAILLGIYAMSLVVWPLMKAGEPHAAQGLVEALPVAIEGVVPSVEGPSRPLWPAVVLVVYYIGLAAVLVSTFVKAFRLVRIIASGKRIDKDGYTLVLLERDGVAPFSWGRYMVMSRADYSEAAGMIECHEKAHIRGGHFVDLLLAQAVCAVMWYNPASWLMLAELKAVHEYEADERVLASGVDAREYQLLLIKKAVGVRFPSLANSLNHSKLKKRITMMYNQKSSAVRRMRALAIVPAVAAALAVVNIPAVAGVMAETSAASPAVLDQPAVKVTQNLADMQVSGDEPTEPKKVTVIDIPEVPAEFPGGQSAMFKFLMDNIKYPEEAVKAGHEGKVLVRFSILADGTIADVEVANNVAPELDAEAVRVVESMPKWVPATTDGKNVVSRFALPVSFKLPGDAKTPAASDKKITVVTPEGFNGQIYINGELYEGNINSIDPSTIKSITVPADKDAIFVITK